MLCIRVLLFALGVYIVLTTIASATRTFVLPRSVPDLLTRRIFQVMRFLFNLRVNRLTEYLEKDRVLALFAPVTLLMLPVVWLTAVLLGYMCMFWALGLPSWYDAFKLSGSSLLTLGFSTVEDMPTAILAFTEAAIGLVRWWRC